MQQTQENVSSNGIGIIVSDDMTEAFVSLQNSDCKCTKEEIIKFLADAGVTSGISGEAIDKMIAEKKTGKNYLVAVSKKPVDGKDGWYEFLFDTDIDTKPKILKDGSVDYSEYGDVPAVEEGQKLVVYHPATESRDGENFLGETVLAKKGKELARLKGKGFYVSEDGKEYFARTSGRAVYQDDRLVEGDISLSRGDITFADDIHIRGNVLSGVTIVSEKGSIIVDGYVEAATLTAGKDVVLKNGMQGNSRGKITAGGSVSGKFFEQSTVDAGEDVNANAIMNSHITAVRDIIVSGRFGIIIGGELHAERYINATIIGNMAEVKTQIYAGVEEDLFAKLMVKEKEQEVLEEELKKVVNGISQIDILMAKTKREDLQGQKLKLIRGKIERENMINTKIREKQMIMDQMGRANLAKVSVQKTLYPGTRVTINGVTAKIAEETSHVVISAKGSVVEVQ